MDNEEEKDEQHFETESTFDLPQKDIHRWIFPREKRNIIMDQDSARGKRERLIKSIATFLNDVKDELEDFRTECLVNNWDGTVLMEIEQACSQLGFSLASLVTWDYDSWFSNFTIEDEEDDEDGEDWKNMV